LVSIRAVCIDEFAEELGDDQRGVCRAIRTTSYQREADLTQYLQFDVDEVLSQTQTEETLDLSMYYPIF
jgi:hypothetical protein